MIYERVAKFAMLRLEPSIPAAKDRVKHDADEWCSRPCTHQARKPPHKPNQQDERRPPTHCFVEARKHEFSPCLLKAPAAVWRRGMVFIALYSGTYRKTWSPKNEKGGSVKNSQGIGVSRSGVLGKVIRKLKMLLDRQNRNPARSLYTRTHRDRGETTPAAKRRRRLHQPQPTGAGSRTNASKKSVVADAIFDALKI
jgi:hypothetical protein